MSSAGTASPRLSVADRLGERVSLGHVWVTGNFRKTQICSLLPVCLSAQAMKTAGK